MNERYIRNIPAISGSDQEKLSAATVMVFGCGGLGGYVIEELARLGIGHLMVADYDVFSESNLNRQLLSNSENIGSSKSAEAVSRVRLINPDIDIVSFNEHPDAQRAAEMIEGTDLVIDALDNVQSRLILEDVCSDKGIPIIHGAVCGWDLQVGVIPPGSGILHSIYNVETSFDDASKTCLCSTAACCASMQVAEAIKQLLRIDSPLSGSIMFMDLKTMESNIVKF